MTVLLPEAMSLRVWSRAVSPLRTSMVPLALALTLGSGAAWSQPAPQPPAGPSTAPQGPAAPTQPARPPSRGGTFEPALPSSPSAQTTPSAQAQIHYERSRAAYAAGHYVDAAGELEAAWRLDPQGTTLLFNLGVVYERMGDLDRATRAYERYLARTDDPEERGRTQRILSRLRGARDEFRALHRRRGLADGLFFATLGASLASTSIGVTWLVTQRSGNSVVAPAVFLSGGVSLGILATVLYFARDAAPARNFYVDASWSDTHRALVVGGTF